MWTYIFPKLKVFAYCSFVLIIGKFDCNYSVIDNSRSFMTLLFVVVTSATFPLTSINPNRNEDATITGLEPATAYLVRARTVTAQFASAHTRALLALTLHEPPARAPISLQASAPRPSTIELMWQVYHWFFLMLPWNLGVVFIKPYQTILKQNVDQLEKTKSFVLWPISCRWGHSRTYVSIYKSFQSTTRLIPKIVATTQSSSLIMYSNTNIWNF